MHTHTHTHFMRNLISSEPKGNFIFRLDGPPCDELLKTATVKIHLQTLNVLFGHVYCGSSDRR